jgi:hypothetical protein
MNLVRILDSQPQVCKIENDTGNVTGNDAKGIGRIQQIRFFATLAF